MKTFAPLLLLLFALPVAAQENFCDSGKPHPIDVWADKAMDKTEGVTANIRDVQSEAYARWDKELNRVYSELLASLKEPDKNHLREAQRAWIKFRDAEVAWLWSDAMYGQSGTSGPIIVSDIGRGYVKQRVCELIGYQKMVNEAKP